MHQLFARAVIVPFAVAPDDLDQLLHGFLAFARGIERDREIDARLVIGRVRRDLLFEFIDRTGRLRLLGNGVLTSPTGLGCVSTVIPTRFRGDHYPT